MHADGRLVGIWSRAHDGASALWGFVLVPMTAPPPCGDLVSCPQSAAKPRLIKPPAGKASSTLINPHQQGHQASSSLIKPPAGKASSSLINPHQQGHQASSSLIQPPAGKVAAGADAEIAGADAETGGKGEAENGVLGSSAEIKGDQGSSAEIKGDQGSSAEIKGDQGISAEIRSEVKAAVATGTGTFSSADWSAIPSAED